MNYYMKLKKGFTLVEALIAVSILMIAVVSTMSISQRSLLSSIVSRDQMTASFLAQDGLEAVKNIRDQVAINALGSTSTVWLQGLEGCLCTGTSCDFTSSSFTYCKIDSTANPTPTVSGIISSNTRTPLQMTNIPDNATGIFLKYDYTGATESKFYRLINIQLPAIPVGSYGSNPNEAIINVRVYWNSQQGQQSVDINDFLYNY